MTIGPVEYVSNFGRKFIRQTWLHEEPGTALMLGAFSQRWSRVAGEHDDRYVSRSRLALQALNQLPSVTVAQRQVRNDDVRTRFPSPAVGLVAISGPDDFETEKDKALDVKLTRVVVVVDDKYQRSGRRVPGTPAIHGVRMPSKKL
jgi:hypothetical protein